MILISRLITSFNHSPLPQTFFQIYLYAIFGDYCESKVYLVQTVRGIADLKDLETTSVTHYVINVELRSEVPTTRMIEFSSDINFSK